MAVLGIGTDIVSVARVARACENESFAARCFTPREWDWAGKNPARLAGAFAAKEAAAKALGTGFRGFWPADIEITHNENGAPEIVFYNKAREIAEALGCESVNASISHEREFAAAVVVIEGAPASRAD